MIDTRQELIIALRSAAELEHGLMVQYLYAAMTLKRDHGAGLTLAQSTMVQGWRTTITAVAKQEMGHLATVQNLLSIIGGAPHFSLPPFPITSGYFRPAQQFTLEPLTLRTITRFVQFEAPLPPPVSTFLTLAAPDPLKYRTVGDLYNQILRGLEKIPEADLFLDLKDAQDPSSWSTTVIVRPARALAEARDAIRHIVDEGEATTSPGPESHYQRFRDIQTSYEAELHRDPSFVPHRPVGANPTISDEPRHGATVIEPLDSRAVADLFNGAYTAMLFGLAQYYKFQDTDDAPDLMRSVTMGLMRGVLLPIGEHILPDLPADHNGQRAASPPFEAYAVPLPHWHSGAAWKLLIEQLSTLLASAKNLAGVHPRMPGVIDALTRLASIETPT